ncbi:MAG: Maf family protein [Candidatus Eisenbacteria bacterium]
MFRLILASTAAHRRELLARLGLPFDAVAPAFTELAPPEAPRSIREVEDLVLANARGKAESLRGSHPDALILAADQLCECDGRIFGKPGSSERAIEQLTFLTGKTHRLHNGVVLLDARSGRWEEELVRAELTLRPLDAGQIRRYVERERPWHSAGSYLSERLGIALFGHLQVEDPTAIIGLPLIAVTRLLGRFGVDPLNFDAAPATIATEPTA